MNLKVVNELTDLKGKVVIVRSSCNVPLVDGGVRNSFRLKRALPTLEFLREKGAKTIVVSHIGRDASNTLYPVFEELNTYIKITWGGKITDKDFQLKKAEMKDGDIILCENLRQDLMEEENDLNFVQEISKGVDLYVNDAFAEIHRDHASTLGLASVLPAYAGVALAAEVEGVSRVMSPISPAIFLLGGAKFETKMPLVEKYLDLYDHVFIGGALANDILKARGYEVGLSLVSDISLENAPFLNNEKLLIPIDLVVDGPGGVKIKSVNEVELDEKIMDMGPKTVEMLRPFISSAKTILWNGPFGNYEAGFVDSTEAVAKIISDAEGFSVLGGGDTVAAVEKLKLNDRFGFVSIGGGSMLTLLEHGSTPVLDKLLK